MKWSWDLDMIATAITDVIHYISNTIAIIIETLKISF